MRIPVALLLLLLAGGCRTPDVATFDVHAHLALFHGEKLPAIDVVPPPDQQPAHFDKSVRFFDAEYHEVTTASKPGRYGAVVTLHAGRRTVHRYLTLFRFPARLDWDGARLDWHAHFSKQFGIADAVADRERDQIGEFFKFALHHAAQSETNESNWQAAAVVAGLYEASQEKQPATRPFVQRDGFAARDQRWWFGLRRKLGLPGLPYILGFHVVIGGPPVKRPLIVFLHGSGEAGDGDADLAKVARGGFPCLGGPNNPPPPGEFPFIVLAPQAPPLTNWSPYEVVALVDEISAKYPVDPDRIYLTGLSLGGYGVWDTAMAFPDRFAAIAPVAGAGDPADAARLGNLPVWIFHGEDDPTIPVFEARRMADALTAAKHPPKLTIYPKTGHGSWSKAYRDPELYQWFLSHTRQQILAHPH